MKTKIKITTYKVNYEISRNYYIKGHNYEIIIKSILDYKN